MNFLRSLGTSLSSLGMQNVSFYMMLFLGFMMVATDLMVSSSVAVYQWIIFTYAILIIMTRPLDKKGIKNFNLRKSIIPAIITFVLVVVVLVFIPLTEIGIEYPRPDFSSHFWMFAWFIGVIGFSETIIFQRNIGSRNKILGILSFAGFHVGTLMYFGNFSFMNIGIIAFSGLIFQFIHDFFNSKGMSGLLITSIVHGLIDAFKYGFLIILGGGLI